MCSYAHDPPPHPSFVCSEASACIELGLPYGMLSFVDNYANGIGVNFTVEEFHAQQTENLGTVKTCVSALLAGVVDRAVPASSASPGAVALFDLLKSSSAARKDGPQSSRSGAPEPAPAALATVPVSPCGPTEVDLIVHARWVVPVSPGHEQLVLNHHSVVVDGGRIVDILPWAEAEARYKPTTIQTLGPAVRCLRGWCRSFVSHDSYRRV